VGWGVKIVNVIIVVEVCLPVRRELGDTIHCSNVGDEFIGERLIDAWPFVYVSFNPEKLWFLYDLLLAADFGISCHNPLKYRNLIFIVILRCDIPDVSV
jgi:hypothetical protein